MRWLDKIPLSPLLIVAVVLATLPVVPEPHLWEKLKLLADGSLSRPIDIADMLMHGVLLIPLAMKLMRMRQLRMKPKQD